MKTFLCEYIHPAARKALDECSEIVSDWERFAECDAAINRNLKFTREVLKQAKKMKVIAVHGSGMDGVDVKVAEQAGIQVFNTPYRNAASVAELNIALMLMAARKMSRVQTFMAAGESFGNPVVVAEIQGMELSEKTVAFLGVGEIAKRTIAICRHGFSMHCIGWSRSLTKEKAERYGIEYADSIQAAVECADFVVLGMALNEETRGMIGENEISAMKQGAVLINAARGALVQEDALYRALSEKNAQGRTHLFAAGLDVVAEEPFYKENSLYRLPNVVLTPHIGANTEEALYRVGMACVEGIKKRLYVSEKV